MNSEKLFYVIFIMAVLLLCLPLISTGQDDISVSEFDTYGKQNNQIIVNQRKIIRELEKTVQELGTQNKNLAENMEMLSNILITNINYIQNLETQNSNINQTLESMNEVLDRTSKELRNLRLEINKLRDSVKELSEKVTPRRHEIQ